MIYYSHPGKELKTHLENVKHIGLNIFESKSKLNFTFKKEDLKTSLAAMLYYHDIGKSTVFFQDYIMSIINDTEYKGKKNLKSHALVSAVYASYKIYNRFSGAVKEILPIIVFACIYKHHGNFHNLEDMATITKDDRRLLKEQWPKLRMDCIDEVLEFDYEELEDFLYDLDEKVLAVENSMENYFLMNFFFSILTYADKNDAIFDKAVRSAGFDSRFSELITNYKNKKFGSHNKKSLTKLNRMRDDIYSLCEENIKKAIKQHNIFSINVPTGSGKTLTVLNTALKIIEADPTLKRIVYAFPFTSIIDQTEVIVREIFDFNNLESDDYLLVHHHLSEAKIVMDENTFAGDKAQFIIENWEKPLILTTFWQFFNTLISNENQLIRKFHNLADSVVMLDEIQSIPYEYWNLVNEVLKKLTVIFNCKIILLTATMPMIFSAAGDEIIHLVDEENRLKYFNSFSRYKLKTIKNLDNISVEELFEIAREHILSEKSKNFLFVFNTIKSSKIFYKLISGLFQKENLVYLSTNILPVERKNRIDNIKKDKTRKIVISTQLIEAGVDIDLDIVYRDFAPLDSIVQASGRCNRNSKQKEGTVCLFSLKKSGSPRKDSNYIYEHHSLLPTEKLFESISGFKESSLLLTIDTYYKNVKEMISDSASAEIIKNITFLEYEDIYKNFHLIKYMPTELVFIENDSSATNVLNKFEALLEIEDRWERKNKFLEIKKDFYNYTLSVKAVKQSPSLSNFEELSHFNIITKDIVADYYDEETGYHEPDQIIF
jgi:CRISPR-associated endonuclease/helicase Cas3